MQDATLPYLSRGLAVSEWHLLSGRTKRPSEWHLLSWRQPSDQVRQLPQVRIIASRGNNWTSLPVKGIGIRSKAAATSNGDPASASIPAPAWVICRACRQGKTTVCMMQTMQTDSYSYKPTGIFYLRSLVPLRTAPTVDNGPNN